MVLDDEQHTTTVASDGALCGELPFEPVRTLDDLMATTSDDEARNRRFTRFALGHGF